jgi:hypothetical protein
MDTVDKLAYIYINSALLDTVDQNDYFDDVQVSDDEDIYNNRSPSTIKPPRSASIARASRQQQEAPEKEEAP